MVHQKNLAPPAPKVMCCCPFNLIQLKRNLIFVLLTVCRCRGGLDEVQKQQVMVERAEYLLQVLSAFEESAASCISEMLLHFSNENHFACVLQAAQFIQHTEILFSSLESISKSLHELNDQSPLQAAKEPKQLVKKIFYFFTNLSGNDSSERQHATLGLIQQVTSLAHTLKKVIRMAFSGSLRLVIMFSPSNAVFDA